MQKGALIKWTGGVAIVVAIALVATLMHRWPHQATELNARLLVPLVTPAGITLQVLNLGEQGAPKEVFADAGGMSLYVFDQDRAVGKSTCTGECARLWPPASAPSGAVASGDWTLLKRDDGTQQWALRGAPVYRFTEDAAIGDGKGDGAAGGAWHVAVFEPGAGLVLPDSIRLGIVSNGAGVGLTDTAGMTLYVFDGDNALAAGYCKAGSNCARHWMPFEAAAMANQVGEFTPTLRDDGIMQWMHRGRALYRFVNDREAGDVSGIGADVHFQAALTMRQFMPVDVMIRRHAALGEIVTLINGMTLYQRDRPATLDGVSFRSDHGTVAMGRAFGTATCSDACLKSWPPFLAPAEALPSGYWDIARRDDGRRQWTYKGYALYTYVGDKPGDVSGNNLADLPRVSDSGTDILSLDDRDAPLSVPGAGLAATTFLWHAVIP